MENDASLVKLEPLPTLDMAAVPSYFASKLSERDDARSKARVAAGINGVFGAYFTLATMFLAFLCVTSWGAAPLVLSALMALLTGTVGVITVKALWGCLERVGYLRGTRDETKYLPRNCRAYAAEEARLSAEMTRTNADIIKWRETLPLLEEYGTPKLLEAARAARQRLEERTRTIAETCARLWCHAAASEDPSPPRSLSGPSVKALPPPSDWGAIEKIDLG